MGNDYLYKLGRLWENMTKPIMLITGTSRGIGSAVYDYFKNDYGSRGCK